MHVHLVTWSGAVVSSWAWMRGARPGKLLVTAQRPVVVFLGGLALVVGAAGTAGAHDQLLSSTPPDGTVLAAAPGSIELVFNQPPIALGAEVAITGPDGDVTVDELELVDASVSQPLPPGLPNGDYAVAWRVTSSDGHPISGTSTFTVAGSLSPAASAGPEPVAPEPSPTPAAAPQDGPARGGPSPAGWSVAVAVLALGGAGTLVLRRRRHSG